MEKWRFIEIETPNLASFNLAIEEAMFLHKIRENTPPTVRFWRNKNAVVIGYSQKVKAEVNIEVCKREGIQIVRRFSGGGAVYHDLGNINYTIIIEVNHPLIHGSDLAETYKVLSSGIVYGLEEFGISAVFSPLSDLLVKDRKISGTSQARRGGIILHHGTLLFDSDLQKLQRSLNTTNVEFKSKIPSCIKPVTQIRDEIGYSIEIFKLKSVLHDSFEKAFSVEFFNDELSLDEIEKTNFLFEQKYSMYSWTYRR